MRASSFFLFFVISVTVTFSDAHFRAKSFKYKDNHKSNGREILQNLTVNSVAKCAYQCTSNEDCDDANFDKESKVCQLLKRKPDGVLLSLVEHPGLLYLGDADEIRKQENQQGMNREGSEFLVSGTSCKAIYDSGRSTGSKAYNLTFGMNTNWSMTYCMMNQTDGCGSGGWTLAMKIDGTKQVFNYDSPLWTNKEAYDEPSGQTGTETLTEAKMPTFWRTPFTKVCLGMKSTSRGGDVRWLTINKTADSLLSIFADGTEKTTIFGRFDWVQLFLENVLSNNACKEGFNIENTRSSNKARLGILAQKYIYCKNHDSYIGVGTQSISYSVSCGSSNSLKGPAVPTNCFIFVQ